LSKFIPQAGAGKASNANNIKRLNKSFLDIKSSFLLDIENVNVPTPRLFYHPINEKATKMSIWCFI
jgi:hypothetical protein